jgi:16S rRNA (cytosine967-C5)-methyltransferase
VQAAIEVLGQVLERHQPSPNALAEWGRAHRFAGAGDRAAIGNLVFDALRRRGSLAFLMDDDSPRALALAALRHAWGMSPDAIAALADGSQFAPAPLGAAEQAGLEREMPADAPIAVRGDIPEWLVPSFQLAFGDKAAQEGAALARRAPIDLRVNTLKSTREKLTKALARFDTSPTPLSPFGLRIMAPEGPARAPNVEAEAAHGRGHFEVQDEGSQIAALLAGAKPGMQVADICAGSGGKTLALAAAMENRGQIHAYDGDRLRLRPIFERLQRAGVRNTQVLDAGRPEALAALEERMDLVLVDAPCSGSGVWRRRPDAKWRLRRAQLAERQDEQREVLALAAPLVKPGGRLVYVTCSVLPEENGAQVRQFKAEHAEFALESGADSWRASLGGEPPRSADGASDSLLLTPAAHGTDGFFIAILRRKRG